MLANRDLTAMIELLTEVQSKDEHEIDALEEQIEALEDLVRQRDALKEANDQRQLMIDKLEEIQEINNTLP